MNTLLCIDPQIDFHEGGALQVIGANANAEAVAAFIDSNRAKVDRIVVTLDTHHKLHIAHAAFWQGGSDPSLRPPNFSVITRSQVESGEWTPRDPSLKDYALSYVSALEARGRFVLVVWPEHCLKGSTGHAISPVLSGAFDRWLDHHAAQSREIQYVLKGENRLTEMYSALAAEVPIPSDPSTQYNTKLRDQLLPGSGPTGNLIVCGQAMSHCVNFTLRDILGDHPGGTRASPAVCAKVTLLEDGASSVGGFEDKAAQFVADMRAFGCRVALSKDVVL